MKRSPTRGSEMLRAWMVKRRLTQQQAAQVLGVGQTLVSSWLLGAEPKLSSAFAIQRITRIPPTAWVER